MSNTRRDLCHRFLTEKLEHRLLLAFDFIERASLTLDSVALPSDVGTADLDNDGDLDAISFSRGDGKLAWYENLDGSGTFGGQRIVWQEGGGYRSRSSFGGKFKTLDFDDDGDIDFVALLADRLVVIKNSGNQGLFAEPIQIAKADPLSYQFLHDFDVADFDGDGDLDIAVGGGRYRAGEIQWFENVGDQYIAHEVANNAATNRLTITSSDIDLDGDVDLVVGALHEAIWYDNTGDGTFDEKLVLELGEGGILNRTNITVADIDADGDRDLLVNEQGFVAVWDNMAEEGSVNFSPRERKLRRQVNDVVLGDIDGDGISDAVFATHRSLAYRLNNGDGTFGRSRDIFKGEADHIHFADLDGDSDLDLLIASRANREVSWYRNIGEVRFEFADVLSIRSNHQALGQTVPTDLDGDSDQDIVTIDFSGQVGWYENDFGQYDAFVELGEFDDASPLSVGASVGAAVVDLDNDGDRDILAYNQGNIVWFQRFGAHVEFSEPRVIARSDHSLGGFSRYAFVQTYDIDGDSDQDVIARAYNPTDTLNTLIWFENDPAESQFRPPRIIRESAVPISSYDVADIDSDGDGDLIVAENDLAAFDNTVFWLKNDGTGDFDADPNIIYKSELSMFTGVLGDDIDSDGDTDVVTTLSSELTLLENDDGDFVANKPAEFTDDLLAARLDGETVHLAAKDLDEDGDLDVLATSYSSNQVGIYEFTHQGFVRHALTDTAFGVRTADPVDVDSDGNLEILVASTLDNRISWFAISPRGDFDRDGQITADDLDALCEQIHEQTHDSRFDLDASGHVDRNDLVYLVERVFETVFGDANLDGVFNSADLVHVFQRGEFEDGIDGNSTWADGDWNCDGEFDARDFVIAFRSAGYVGE